MTSAALAANQNQFTQSVLFSIFCGLLVLISYLLSRQTSDILVYFNILKEFIRDKLVARNNRRLQRKFNKQNKNTIIAGTSDIVVVDSTSTNNKLIDNLSLISLEAEPKNKSNNMHPKQKEDADKAQVKSLKDKSVKSVYLTAVTDESNIQPSQKNTKNKSNSASLFPNSSKSSNSRNSIGSRSDSLASVSSYNSIKTNLLNKNTQDEKVSLKYVASQTATPSAIVDDNELKEKNSSQPEQQTEPYYSSPRNENSLSIKVTCEAHVNEAILIDDQKSLNIDYSEDILEKRNKLVIKSRLESDALIVCFIFLLTFAVHVSTAFSSLKPTLNDILFCLAIVCGGLNHYVLPHLRLENPWYIFSRPMLRPDHWRVFEPNSLAKLTWYECVHVVLIFLEKNCLNILVILSSITMSGDQILLKFESFDGGHGFIACLVISIISLKLMRHSFCEPAKQYQIFLIAYLFNKFDSYSFCLSNLNKTLSDKSLVMSTSAENNCQNETILFDLFFVSLFLEKLRDFVEKLTFVFVYTAPWQLPWGSAFHAFAQPLSVPHSALLVVQAVISSLFCTPLMPLMGSAIFLLSYMRPVNKKKLIN
jgi:hypothetical protein